MLIKLSWCPGWSESSMGAHVILLVYQLSSSFLLQAQNFPWKLYFFFSWHKVMLLKKLLCRKLDPELGMVHYSPETPAKKNLKLKMTFVLPVFRCGMVPLGFRVRSPGLPLQHSHSHIKVVANVRSHGMHVSVYSLHFDVCSVCPTLRCGLLYLKKTNCLHDRSSFQYFRPMSRDMTKPTKWVCAQRRLRSAWASAQSDQSLRCVLSG